MVEQYREHVEEKNDEELLGSRRLVITKECLARIPVVAHAFFLAVEEGKEAAIKYLDNYMN